MNPVAADVRPRHLPPTNQVRPTPAPRSTAGAATAGLGASRTLVRLVSAWFASVWLVFFPGLLLGGIPEGKPLPERVASHGPLFRIVPPELSGVDLVHEFPARAPVSLMQEQGAGSGVAIGDVDGDGLPDLYFTHYDQGGRLYRNLGGWRFRDVTEVAGVRVVGHWGAGAAFVDIDNDGDLDLHVACYRSANLLFVNRGDGTFTNRAEALGLAWVGSSVMGAFADYDRDGRLDLYLLTHRDASSPRHRLPAGTDEAVRRGILVRSSSGRIEVSERDRDLFELIPKGDGKAELGIAGEADRLFRQGPDGRFVDVTLRSGIVGQDIGLGASWWDYDGDGWLDVYVANDHKTADRLWHNQRDGTFRDVTRSALPHVPLSSMGTDIADIDDDGRLDLFATDMAGSRRERRMRVHDGFEKNGWFLENLEPRQYPRNALYLATGTSRVFEVAFLAGVAETDWTWSPKWGDFDNDGRTDLFVANGMSRDYLDGDLIARMGTPGHPGWRSQAVLREANLAFRNLGNLAFEPEGSAWGLDRVSASFGAATGDLDRDGDLDLVVMNLGESPTLYENQESRHHRIVIRLVGRGSNRFGVGAVVRAYFGGGIRTRTVSTASGFVSSNEPLLHFGLGEHTGISRLAIQWPDGRTQEYADVLADRFYTLEEPASDEARSPGDGGTPRPWFRGRVLADFVHRRATIDEYVQETSLPWQLTRGGPVLATGDLADDGGEGFYLTGSRARVGASGIRRSGGFVGINQPVAYSPRTPVAEADAVFFDVDNDDLLDLVVTGDGGISGMGAETSRGRFLRGGEGPHLGAGTDAVFPPGVELSGVVAAGDIDRDGDLDLFVGGGSESGKYPVSRHSYLFRNDAGRFVDVTEAMAPGLRSAGIVRGAVWSDVDRDGWPDLILAREWGPIGLFRHRAGRWVDETANAGFENRRGLWQAVGAVDVDGDGDTDLVAGNFGINSRYAACRNGPIRLSRGDLWGTGRIQLLESFVVEARRYPFRNRSTLLREAPFLVGRFPNHASIAESDVATLLGSDEDRSDVTVEIDTVESGIWFNDGAARFRFEALPVLAQAAPVFAIASGDFDGDAREDVVLAQNFRGANLEIGPLDGGMGLLLRGRGDGGFDVVRPLESGFVVPGEARTIAVTDVDADGFPDLLVGIHDGAMQEFRNVRASESGECVALTVEVRGSRGNRTAVGAWVEVDYRDGRRRTVEVGIRHGGGIRHGSRHLFAHRRENPVTGVRVRWPDGLVSIRHPVPGARLVQMEKERAEPPAVVPDQSP